MFCCRTGGRCVAPQVVDDDGDVSARADARRSGADAGGPRGRATGHLRCRRSSLRNLAFRMGRFKTGTPPASLARVQRRPVSIRSTARAIERPTFFSRVDHARRGFRTGLLSPGPHQFRECTSWSRNNLDRSPMYTGCARRQGTALLSFARGQGRALPPSGTSHLLYLEPEELARRYCSM